MSDITLGSGAFARYFSEESFVSINTYASGRPLYVLAQKGVILKMKDDGRVQSRRIKVFPRGVKLYTRRVKLHTEE